MIVCFCLAAQLLNGCLFLGPIFIVLLFFH